VVIDAPRRERSRAMRWRTRRPLRPNSSRGARPTTTCSSSEAEAAMEFSHRALSAGARCVARAPRCAAACARPQNPLASGTCAPLDGRPRRTPPRRHGDAAAHRRLVGRDPRRPADPLRLQEPGHDPERHRPDDRWGWRRRSRLRPLRFRASATADADTVHLHLEHRVAQRLLATAHARTGFIAGRHARATAFVTDDGADRVILLGRLCVFGPRRARASTTRFSGGLAHGPGPQPNAPARCSPLRCDLPEEVAVAKDFQVALTATDAPPLSDFLRRRLLQSVATDVAELTPSLQRTVTTQSEAVRTRLARIAERQAQSLDQQLQRQQVQLTRRLSQSSQLSLAQQKGFDEADRAAWKATLRAWGATTDRPRPGAHQRADGPCATPTPCNTPTSSWSGSCTLVRGT
jgi:hypothetical protein